MKRIWYGVFAENGLGVYADYRKLMRSFEYIRSIHMKKFSTRDEAEAYAVDGFTSLHGINALLVTVPDLDALCLNFFYYKKAAAKEPEDKSE